MKNRLFTITSCEKDHGASEMILHNRHKKKLCCLVLFQRYCWFWTAPKEPNYQLECLLSTANKVGQRNQGKAAWAGNSYQVYKYETGNFFEKMHVYLIKMVIHSIFKVMAIASHTFFPSLWQFVYASSKKLFVFWVKPVIETFFHIFVRIEALFSKCVPHW